MFGDRKNGDNSVKIRPRQEPTDRTARTGMMIYMKGPAAFGLRVDSKNVARTLGIFSISKVGGFYADLIFEICFNEEMR